MGKVNARHPLHVGVPSVQQLQANLPSYSRSTSTVVVLISSSCSATRVKDAPARESLARGRSLAFSRREPQAVRRSYWSSLANLTSLRRGVSWVTLFKGTKDPGLPPRAGVHFTV